MPRKTLGSATALVALMMIAVGTVTATSHQKFDTGFFGEGQSAAHTFAEAGEYPYHCTPHPWMKGTVVVKEGAPSSVTVRIVDAPDPDVWRYEPARVEVAPGGTVVWENNSTEPHTATEDDDSPGPGAKAPGLSGLVALAVLGFVALLAFRRRA